MDPTLDPTQTSLPVGRSGRIEAMGLAAAGDHAVLVRETGTDRRGRALLTTDKLADGERLVVMPLDDEVEVRVDGDALAVWLGAGSMASCRRSSGQLDTAGVPAWASVVGGAAPHRRPALRRHRLGRRLHLADEGVLVSDAPITPPASGLVAMRIGVEFGGAEGFSELVTHALARGGERGATLVAKLDLGDLGIHIPRVDGPCWNSVPLFHLHRASSRPRPIGR